MAGRTSKKSAKPILLAGGNPQIAKGEGDAPVRAYIAAMPGWKSDASCPSRRVQAQGSALSRHPDDALDEAQMATWIRPSGRF